MQMSCKHNKMAEGEATQQKQKAPQRERRATKSMVVFFLYLNPGAVRCNRAVRTPRGPFRKAVIIYQPALLPTRKWKYGGPRWFSPRVSSRLAFADASLSAHLSPEISVVAGGGMVRSNSSGQVSVAVFDVQIFHLLAQCVCARVCVHKNWWEVVTGGCAPLP